METAMMRTAQDVMAVVASRGLSVRVEPGPPPMPVLIVPPNKRDQATEALLDALKAWRLEIIAEVTKD